MRVGYIDCFCGISGDMLLGALLDCGWPEDELRQVARAVGARDVRVEPVIRGPLRALRVWVDAPECGPRGLEEVLALAAQAPVPERARGLAQEAFRLLAEAEARVHGIEPAQVHFHEVGAVDALVDILGATAGVVRLGLERVWASMPPVGSGTVATSHGELPVPAPATAELLRGLPVRLGGGVELTTPTGAVLLRVLAGEVGAPPPMRVEAIGYGAGSRVDPGRTNALRLIVGETVSDGGVEELVEVATNLDDLDPRLVPVVVESALAAGALDAWAEQVLGKKGRPAFVLRLLCRPGEELRFAELLFSLTPTLGVRWQRLERAALERKTLKVETPYGIIRVKAAARPGGEWTYSPEFEDCRAAARAAGVSPAAVIQEAVLRARKRWAEGPPRKEDEG